MTQHNLIDQAHVSANASVGSNDEIDLVQLFNSMLRVWKYWVLALISVSLMFGAVKAYQILIFTHEAVYSKPIRLTFSKSQQLEFPSGAKFAYSDIVAPVVVQLAFEKNKLSNYGFTVADLQRGLSSVPYAPTYPLIIARYEKLLNDKKLTFEQINDLQKRMEDELQQATSGEALITLRLQKKELPKAIADKVLSDIPAIWAEKAMNEKGVLSINTQLASVSSLNSDLIKQSEGLIAGDLLYEKLALLKKNIKSMSEYEGSQSIKDPITGMRLLDLSFAVDDLGRYVVGDLISPLRELGLSRDIYSTLYYYQDKVNRLQINLTSLKRQANAIKEVYESYLQADRKNLDQSKDGQSTSITAIPQLNTDIVDKLVALSSESIKEQYKQDLNRRWFLLTKELADVESALSDAHLVLAAVQKTAISPKKLSSGDEQYLMRFQVGLPKILPKIESFFDVSDRIYRQLSVESVGVKDQLYIPVTNTILTEKTLLDVKSTLLIWLALMFITTIVIIPIFMIRNAMKERGNN